MIKIRDLVFEYPTSHALASLAKCIESDSPSHRPYRGVGGSSRGMGMGAGGHRAARGLKFTAP